MFVNKSESHERVLNAAEDIKACCEVSDYYSQWSDIAASSIQAFLEDLTAEQLDDTCGAFREYITETVSENENLARGIKDALMICLNEMIDYIGEVPDTSEVDEDEKDFYDAFNDSETAEIVKEMKFAIETLYKVSI